MKHRSWVVVQSSRGVYRPDCLRLVEGDVRELGEGELLVRTLPLSLDPTSRNWLKLEPHSQYLPIKIGDVMLGVALGEENLGKLMVRVSS
jgi:NADPH-dependent curcumin reductase CurA